MSTRRFTAVAIASCFSMSLLWACSAVSPPGHERGQAIQGVALEGCEPPEVHCSNDGKEGDIEVVFSSDNKSVSIASCKDLSNVVLQFADGSEYKFDGLSGTSGVFSGTGENTGKEITAVWVKAGSNHSGDGSGYGE